MTDGLSEAYDMKKWDVFCEYNDLLLENDQLQAENKKLRALVRDMNECIEHSSLNCDGCLLDKCKLNEFNCRMRELGVDA